MSEAAIDCTIESVSLDEALKVHQCVPELKRADSVSEYHSRIGQAEYLALVATVDSRPVGFKLGFALDDDQFYSWVGGVRPDYRGYGVGWRLLAEQEAWALKSGYRSILVKSMNRFPPMICLLVSRGYAIVAYEKAAGGEESKGKIVFQKALV